MMVLGAVAGIALGVAFTIYGIVAIVSGFSSLVSSLDKEGKE